MGISTIAVPSISSAKLFGRNRVCEVSSSLIRSAAKKKPTMKILINEHKTLSQQSFGARRCAAFGEVHQLGSSRIS